LGEGVRSSPPPERQGRFPSRFSMPQGGVGKPCGKPPETKEKKNCLGDRSPLPYCRVGTGFCPNCVLTLQ
jgi:hypothetical protein